jgi:hypothetical protein
VKMNRGGASLKKFARETRQAEKRQAKQAKHSKKSASATVAVGVEGKPERAAVCSRSSATARSLG